MNLKTCVFYSYFPVVFLILFLIGGCSYKARNVILRTPFDSDTLKNVFVANAVGDTAGYYNTIMAEDELAISNLQDISLLLRTEKETYNQRTDVYAIFKVNLLGFISLPILGPVKVAGLNRAEAGALIQKLYESKELKVKWRDKENTLLTERILS
jgi:polysaccharide export outer membrane protein